MAQRPTTKKVTRFLLTSCVGLFALNAAAVAQETDFTIPEQDLGAALNAFGLQSGREILFSVEEVAGKTAPAVKGVYSIEDALGRLLGGSGIEYRINEKDTVLVGRLSLASVGLSGERDTSRQDRGARAVSDRSASTAESEELSIETLIVTGTRITGATPTAQVLQFDKADIDASGFSTVGEFLQTVPQNFASQSPATGGVTRSNVGFGTGVDLRGLGADSTLLLVNGRRLAPSGGDLGGFVDVSIVPVSAISRVEVFTDGASAIYGADAIGGVVNLLLQDDFAGAETTVRYGLGENGGDDWQLAQVLGTGWGSGRVFAALEYAERDPVRSRDIGIATADLTSQGGSDFCALNVDTVTALPPPAGAGILTDFLPAVVPFAGVPAGTDGTGLTLADFQPFVINSADLLPQDITPQTEQLNAFITLEQDLTDTIAFFADGLYLTCDATVITQPAVLNLVVGPTNPFSPFSQPVGIRYATDAEFGNGRQGSETETVSVNAGLEGGFGASSNWDWTVFASYAQDQTTSVSSALDPVLANVFASGIDPATGMLDPAVAFNPFGDGSAQNPATLDAILSENTLNAKAALLSVQGRISGDLFDIGGGTVKTAFGVEYREEELEQGGTLAGGLPLSVIEGGFGKRDVFAAYGEVAIPLIGADTALPGVRSLDINIAGRYEDYSDFGDSFNPRVGVAWGVSGDLTLKASWGTSFKAPLLNELAGTVVFIPAVTVLDANAPGGPAPVSVAVTAGGNADLQEETAQTFSVSAQFTPAALPGLSVEVGYFDISFEDRIRDLLVDVGLANVFQLEAFLPAGSVVRDAGGHLTALNLGSANSARTDINGIDFSVRYATDIGAGVGSVGLSGAHLFAIDDQFQAGGDVTDLAGTLNNPADLRLRGSVGYQIGGFNANLFVNHTGDYENTASAVQDTVEAYTTVDLQFGYQPDLTGWLDGVRFSVGANNLFNADFPFVDDAARLGVDTERVDVRGRVVYFRVSIGFGVG